MAESAEDHAVVEFDLAQWCKDSSLNRHSERLLGKKGPGGVKALLLLKKIDVHELSLSLDPLW